MYFGIGKLYQSISSRSGKLILWLLAEGVSTPLWTPPRNVSAFSGRILTWWLRPQTPLMWRFALYFFYWIFRFGFPVSTFSAKRSFAVHQWLPNCRLRLRGWLLND